MKNFTKQNFKTNPLWIRLLIMTFMLLIGAGSAWGKVLYLKPNSDWESASAKFSVWAWADGGGGKWFAASKGSSGYYEATVDDNRVNFLWARYSSSKSGTTFGSVWNQVGDFKTSNGNLVTITGWSSGTLSTYTPVTITGYALGGFDDWSNLIQMTKNGNVYTCTKDLSAKTYSTNTDAGFKIIEQYSDASAKWFGNNGTMTRSESSGWTMEEGKNNCGITADVAGTYTFTFDASTKRLTVTYPTPTYNITYKDKGNVTFSGTHASGYPTTHTYGTATTLKTASKTGYTFGGWFTNSNCTGNAVTSLGATAYSANITLYAKWTANQYDITYKDQGNVAFSGTHADDHPTKHTYGTATTLKTATKDGYNFLGWFTKSDCSGTAVTSLGATAYTVNITLYAKWELACTPSTSITSATLNQDGTISLVGNFTTCGTQYHGFQWRIKGQEWCPENNPNLNSDYVTKQTDVDGVDTDTFTPTAGNTYEFRTYIYGSPWVYSSGTKEVEVPCPTIAAPTFSVSSKIACKNVAFNLNDLFPRTDSGAGTLEWYKNDGTKVADPTSVSISATTQYYAVLKDGLCSSANSSNVTVNIYTPAISNIKITPYSYGITVQATITGSDLQSMIVECIEKGGDWTNAKTCNQSLKGSGNATCSIEDLVAGSDYQVRISANTKTCSELFTYSAVQDVKTTCDEIPDAPDIITSGVVCPNTNITLSDYNNGIDGVKWYSNAECTTPASATVSISSNKMYYARIEDGGCASDASTLSLTLYPTPQTPVVTISPNPVGQNKPTTLTVGEYNGTLNNYTLYKDGNSQGAYTTPQTITIGEIGKYDYYVVATSKACPSLTATSETVTLEVLEAGAKIDALGATALFTNDPTHFIPMYVEKDGIVDVEGATKVEGYTWEFSENGSSNWTACNYTYANFNAKNNKSQHQVVVTNGDKDCNNWRANAVGYYRCKMTYDTGASQYSNSIQVTAGTNSNTNKQHIGITYNLPIISVNTGDKDFPSDASLSGYPSASADDLKKKRSVDVKIFNPDGTVCYDRKARMAYRGSSSLNFKKKSYAFCPGKAKCGDEEKSVDYVKTSKENLFGLSNGAEDKDWVLYAATPEPSMMRNRLTFDLYKEMRPQDWGVNSMYVELVINGEYKGVYVLMDKITQNKNRVKLSSADAFIVKFDKTDCADRIGGYNGKVGDEKTFITSKSGKFGIDTYGTKVDQAFEIEYPEKEDFEDVNVGSWVPFTDKVKEKFVQFETALEKKDYTTVRSIIDYDSWADWYILTEFIKNQDGFRASNIFVYDGEKIEARPLWDQELSFKNKARIAHSCDNAGGLLVTTSSIYEDDFKPPFWFTGGNNSISGGLLSDPCFVSLVKQKWAEYSQDGGLLTKSHIESKVSAYDSELGAAQSREAARWPYTGAVRGMTNNGKTIGYYGKNEGIEIGYADSKSDILSWANDRVGGLTTALNGVEGEALIFTMTPSVEVTPWQAGLISIHASEGYKYTVDFSEVEAVGGYVKNENTTYTVKLPRPADWTIGGNGSTSSATYNVIAKIEIDSEENTCGFESDENTKTSVITLKDEVEECNPEVTR